MAEGVVSFLLPKLSLLVLEEANLIRGIDTQIISLHDELEWINSFLRDADEKRRRYRRVNVWVNQIRNLAYDAEDIIDLFMLEVEQQRQRNVGLRFVCYPKHLFTLRKLVKKIDDVNRRIEKISANKSKYGIEDLEAGETSARSNDGVAWKVRRAPIEEELDVVGFEEDMKKLAMLLTKEESRQLRVVSIVGMGGLGKTTLAKSVYKRSDVKSTFDSYAWIYVSQEYRMKDLLCEAITQIMGLKKSKLETKSEEELGEELSNYLKERRCLLVFDDVWRREDWESLKKAFLLQGEVGKHRRVLLTTRNVEVAEHTGPSTEPHVHKLGHLDDEEGFKLFLHKVFQFQEGIGERSCPKELEELGRKLVTRCGGLPLAIVVLGGLLSTKEKSPTVWSNVLESVTWQLSEGPQQCMDILAMSYTNLPYYLQSCFLYFGLFPEDSEIPSKKLIQLWIAEGFIQGRGDETMEDVAEEYLEELIQRSMIQVASRRSDGGVKTCRIHDLLRDFAVSEGKKDKLVEIYGNNHSTSLDRFRWFAIHPNNGTHNISSSTLAHIHSLLCFNIEDLQKKPWKGLYVGFNVLRVLDLEGVKSLHNLPNEIGGLLLLKYLNLSRTGLRRIPHSMGNLCNLQTLDLSWTAIGRIPKEIWRMQQLRHLHCYGIWSEVSGLVERIDKVVNKIGQSCGCPPRIDNLRDLQTLSLKAGSWIEAGFDKLTNLRELSIRGDLTLNNKALTDSIVKFTKLRRLRLSFLDRRKPLALDSFSQHVHLYYMYLVACLSKIPEPEDFPPFLMELRLEFTYLQQDGQPMTVLEKLPHLKILELGAYSFVGKKMICSAGGFSKLHNLELNGLRVLEDLEVRQGAFPCLKILTIHRCRRLKTFPHGLPNVTTLQELNISLMPKEFTARAQKDTGKDWEKIKHIPSVSINESYILQKVVLKVAFYDDRGKRKAVEAVSTLPGIDSFAIDMELKKMTVIGEVDPVDIVTKLRKICHTKVIDFIRLAKEPEKKEEES